MLAHQRRQPRDQRRGILFGKDQCRQQTNDAIGSDIDQQAGIECLAHQFTAGSVEFDADHEAAPADVDDARHPGERLAHRLEETATECSLDYEGGPGMGGSGPFGESSGGASPIAVENFHMLQERQTSDDLVSGGSKKGRVNLLNWTGDGVPPGMFPPKRNPEATA